jgi:hypothetical protein
MAKNSNLTDDALRFFKWLFILLMIVVIVITSLWVFIYSLYRIAIFSRLLYSYVFITVLAGVLLFFFVKSIKQKKFSRIVLKFTKFLFTAIMVLLITASFMMYGAFFFTLSFDRNYYLSRAGFYYCFSCFKMETFLFF